MGACKHGFYDDEICEQCDGMRDVNRSRDAEEAALSRAVVEAAMAWAATAPTSGNVYSHRVIVKAVEDACAALRAFRERGSKT